MSRRATAGSVITTIPRLFDTHCHIGLIRRESEEIPAGALPAAVGLLSPTLVYDAITKATEAFKSNVKRFMIVGIDDLTSKQAAYVATLVMERARLAAAAATPTNQFWAGYSVGIHPHYAHEFDKHWPVVERLAREGCVLRPGAEPMRPLAIGETGLDYFKSAGTEDQQKANLRAHLLLAQELNLPLIIHCRDAYDDLFRCFAEWGVTRLKGVLHCFSSGVDHMMQGVALGLKISFCGTLSYPKSQELREAFRACPADALVFETDAPFLPPQTQRGKINVPANVAEIAVHAATVRKMDPVELGELAWRNSCSLFSIPE